MKCSLRNRNDNDMSILLAPLDWNDFAYTVQSWTKFFFILDDNFSNFMGQKFFEECNELMIDGGIDQVALAHNNILAPI